MSSDDEYIFSGDSSSESSDVSDLSPIRNARKKKVNAIISHDEDDDEEEVCSYSPRTRKSITGVRQIYSSDESTDFSSDGDSNESADKSQVTSKSYPINDPDADDVSGMEMSKYKSVNIEDPDIDDDNETSNSNKKSQIKSFSIDDSDISNNQMDITKYRSVNIEDPDDDDKENNEMEITKNKSAANINESINNSIINMTVDEQSKISIIESSMRQMELDQNHSQKSIQQSSDSSSSDDCVIVQDSPSNIGKKFINRIRENATSTPSSKVILKQPTIKTAINENKKPADIQMEVSQEFYDNALKKLQELEFELKNLKHLAEQMGSKLPDNGRRMSERINNLHQQIKEQLRKISTYTVIDEKKSVLEIKKNIAAAAVEIPDSDSSSESSDVSDLSPIRNARKKKVNACL